MKQYWVQTQNTHETDIFYNIVYECFWESRQKTQRHLIGTSGWHQTYLHQHFWPEATEAYLHCEGGQYEPRTVYLAKLTFKYKGHKQTVVQLSSKGLTITSATSACD